MKLGWCDREQAKYFFHLPACLFELVSETRPSFPLWCCRCYARSIQDLPSVSYTSARLAQLSRVTRIPSHAWYVPNAAKFIYYIIFIKHTSKTMPKIVISSVLLILYKPGHRPEVEGIIQGNTPFSFPCNSPTFFLVCISVSPDRKQTK
jgi:hypothetical protein